MKKIFWSVGEKSGDLHAAEILKRTPEFRHYGIGGQEMQKYGFKALYPFERFTVMGFYEVLRHLCFFMNTEREIVRLWQTEKPDLLILVDYPGFNFRLGEKAQRLGIPVLYYISPQFWAWKKKRVKKLRRFADKVACILPFEEVLLHNNGINAQFVGHPLLEELDVKKDRIAFAKKYGLAVEKKWLGFFPGSREIEVRKLLPEYLTAISFFGDSSYEFLVSQTDTVTEALFPEQAGVRYIKGNSRELMANADFLVVKSGTSSLEAALLGTPFVITYITSGISYQIAKYIIKIKYIGLPNIILNDSAVPELIQQEAKAKNLAAFLINYMSLPAKLDLQRQKLLKLREILGTKQASQEVITCIKELL